VAAAPLDKVRAKRDLQRRGVFFKLVFYTFPYFARHYGKSHAKKTRATRFSLSRSFLSLSLWCSVQTFLITISFGLANFVSSATPHCCALHSSQGFAYYLSTSWILIDTFHAETLNEYWFWWVMINAAKEKSE
jgi:hypothetical protein